VTEVTDRMHAIFDVSFPFRQTFKSQYSDEVGGSSTAHMHNWHCARVSTVDLNPQMLNVYNQWMYTFIHLPHNRDGYNITLF